MANKKRGEVEWEFEDKTYLLRLSNNDMVNLEAELGQKGEREYSSTSLQRFAEGRIGLSDCLAVLTRGLRSGGWESAKEIRSFLQEPRLLDMIPIVGKLFPLAMGMDDDEPSESTNRDGETEGSTDPL